MSSKPPSAPNKSASTGDQPPTPPGSKRAPFYAALVAIVVGAIYFINTTGMGVLLPDQYNVDLTAEATLVAEATQTAAAAAALDAPEAAAEGEQAADVAAAEAAAPAAEVAAEAAVEPPAEPTVEPTAEPAAEATPVATATPRPTITPVPVGGGSSRATATPDFPDEVNGLPTIAYDDLTREAKTTIRLIDEGGPFPFERDGITFQNREGLLPDEFRGYYTEYTVITPGENDRGARRIIAGQDGELYYTDDHYDSFSYVVR